MNPSRDKWNESKVSDTLVVSLLKVVSMLHCVTLFTKKCDGINLKM